MNIYFAKPSRSIDIVKSVVKMTHIKSIITHKKQKLLQKSQTHRLDVACNDYKLFNYN
jgi:hypothetical protein